MGRARMREGRPERVSAVELPRESASELTLFVPQRFCSTLLLWSRSDRRRGRIGDVPVWCRITRAAIGALERQRPRRWIKAGLIILHIT